MTSTLTDIFVKGLIAKSREIPQHVIDQAKKCLLDYIGVTVGGARLLKREQIEFLNQFSDEKGTCTIIGTEQKTTVYNAALLNGYAAHVLELDDGHRFGMIHLGASIISAIISVGEKEDLSMQEMLIGIVMGYETAVRCACALQPGHKERGYHVSGTCGAIGSAMGIGFACRYSEQQLLSTLACAVTSAAGVLEIQEDASELKPYNLGRAAMDGVAAAYMGKVGLRGPDDIIGGKRGLLSVLTLDAKTSFLEDFSSGKYSIEGIYQKVYAACRHCHPAIEAALVLREKYKIDVCDIEKIEVRTYRLAVGGHDHKTVKGLSSAKLSTPYSVALALIKGNAGYDDFCLKNIQDEAILRLAEKVEVFVDEELTAISPAIRAAEVCIRTRKTAYHHRVDYPKGEPENPLTFSDISKKTELLVSDYHNDYIDYILKMI